MTDKQENKKIKQERDELRERYNQNIKRFNDLMKLTALDKEIYEAEKELGIMK